MTFADELYRLIPGRSFGFRLLAFLIVIACHRCGYAAVGAGPDAFGYTATTTTFNFEDLTTPAYASTGILDGTDDATITIPIGFPFTFYGVTYTTLTVSTNGLITFGGADPAYMPVNINTTTTPNDLPSIAVFWHDWTFQFLGSDEALYATVGAPGERRLIVQWDFAQSRAGTATDTVTFEAKLFEGSNNIEFHYDDATVSDDSTNSNGLNATVGIRDVHGQQSATNRSLQWSFNQAVINDSTAIKFTAPQFKVNSITRNASKQIVLDCTGAPSIVNHIEYSPDLKTAFQRLPTNPPAASSTGHFIFTDTTATTLVKRFYRVGLP